MTDVNSSSPSKFRTRLSQVNWRNALFLTLVPVAAAILVPTYVVHSGVSWGLFALLIVSFAITNMSITCGYHRYFSHRTYDAHPLVECLYIWVGSAAFQGSVLEWCTDHRRHHRMVDTDEDPYSINKGFWYAHMGWLLVKDSSPYAGRFAHDLEKNKMVAFQHKHYGLISTFMGFGVPALIGWALGFGWGGFVIAGLLRTVLTQHSTFFINSLCHTLGRRPYSDKYTARDSFVMAVLTFGEGYHNYHHSFQADYRNGVRWYHWDPTKWWIKSLSLVGLARRLKKVSKDEIMKARLAMDERILLARGASAERLAALKTRIVEAASRLRQLREEYGRLKKTLPQSAMFVRLRDERKRAKSEFRTARRQWRAYARTVRAEA